MVVRIENPQSTKSLFGDWSETMILSCLQGMMGEIYATHSKDPGSAMAILGDFCFFAGKPEKELICYKPPGCQKNFIIMIPQNEEWAALIADCYNNKAKEVTRYALKKEPMVFQQEKLQAVVKQLDSRYIIKLIDKPLYHLCIESGWSKDLVSQYPDYQTYQQIGLGVVILKDKELVAGASSYSRYRDGIEVEIDTKMEYRRQGLAYICGAKLILECLHRKLYPSWDAQNKESLLLAEKLGYHFDYSYKAFEILEY